MIYAVVWVDFNTLLSIPATSLEDAVSKAQKMDLKARLQGRVLRALRAVSLDTDDHLGVLWENDEVQ